MDLKRTIEENQIIRNLHNFTRLFSKCPEMIYCFIQIVRRILFFTERYAYIILYTCEIVFYQFR